MKKEEKPRTYIHVKRFSGRGAASGLQVFAPKFTIGQKVWRRITIDTNAKVFKCPVCKGRYLEQKQTPVIAHCTIKGVHLYVADSVLVIQYIVDCDRVVDENRLFLTYDDAVKAAHEEIERLGKDNAKRIAAAKKGIKNYRANIRK